MKLLITGGTRGIGFALAKHFAGRGDDVCIVGRKRDHVDGAVDALGCRGIVADVGVSCGLAAWAKEAMGGLDAAICAAGVWHAGDTDVVYTNVLGSWNTALDACRTMSDGGSVVLFAGGGVGGPNVLPGSLYAATKAAVVVMAESLALQYPKLRINSVAPGQVATELTGGVGEGPEKAVELVSWLLSDEAKHITGRCVAVRDERVVEWSAKYYDCDDGNHGRLRRVLL